MFTFQRTQLRGLQRKESTIYTITGACEGHWHGGCVILEAMGAEGEWRGRGGHGSGAPNAAGPPVIRRGEGGKGEKGGGGAYVWATVRGDTRRPLRIGRARRGFAESVSRMSTRREQRIGKLNVSDLRSSSMVRDVLPVKVEKIQLACKENQIYS